MIYSAKDMAQSFRTVRKNTIQVAEDIPDEQYAFRATPDTRTVAEMLAHIAVSTWWAVQVHGVERKSHVGFDDWTRFRTESETMEKTLTTKAEILETLRQRGEAFASLLEGMSDEQLAEQVSFPQPVHPPSRTRFEMLLSVKEHEMHHRGQLMLIERLIGIVPHLSRPRQAAASS